MTWTIIVVYPNGNTEAVGLYTRRKDAKAAALWINYPHKVVRLVIKH